MKAAIFFAGLWLGLLLTLCASMALLTADDSLYTISNSKIERCEASLPRDKHCALIAVEEEL